MANEKIAKTWIKKALSDLKVARFLYGGQDEEFFSACAFNCQQSIEKSLKALLVLSGVRITKTHDLKGLGEAILETEDVALIRDNLSWLKEISDYAVAYRYPDAKVELKPLTSEILKRTLDYAAQIFEMVSGRVK